eukprot:35983_1
MEKKVDEITMSAFHPFFIMVTLICIHCNISQSINYYIEEWKSCNTTNETNDYGMVAGFDITSGLITIVGGTNYQTNHYQYNITSCKLIKLNTSLSSNIYIISPNSYTSLNNMIYFYSEAILSNLYGNSFFTYNMNTLTLSQIGNDYPKPGQTQQECYTTNQIDTIFLIGGQQCCPFFISKTFSAFNTTNNKWIQGPDLIFPRRKAGCIYSNDKIFIFGGETDTKNSSNTIEMINASFAI